VRAFPARRNERRDRTAKWVCEKKCDSLAHCGVCR
jgi:hypothetical protein